MFNSFLFIYDIYANYFPRMIMETALDMKWESVDTQDYLLFYNIENLNSKHPLPRATGVNSNKIILFHGVNYTSQTFRKYKLE